DSYVFYVEPYSKTWPEYDNLVLSISEGDLLGLLDAGEPYPDGFLEHFEILGEPPVLGMQSKTLEVGDDLAGKWVYMPNGAGADVVLSKTLPIDQVGEVAEVDFFLGFFGNPYNSPNQAADDCPCYWDFSELGIEEFTDGSKAYYKIPETFTLSHSAECAINETEEFVAGDLVVKRIDCAEGTELMLFYEAPAVEDETTDNTEKEDKPVIDLDAIGEWFNGIGEDVSAWLSDNDIEISASGVLVVGFAIVIIIGLVRRKRK
ncbi:MAG: hypothetical protein IJW26_01760, partial [Clostridia bacterium]|nr:hypothetical protein [Clostridia bacterium]